MARKKKKFGGCPYCGKEANLTEDHIIPKCLFKPNTLKRAFKIFVCNECNNEEKSKDDSFLRDLLVADIDSQASPIAKFIREQKYESSIKKGKSELKKKYISNSAKVLVQRKRGLYIYGDKFSIENERLIPIFKRIISGLTYIDVKFSHPINDNSEVGIFKKTSSKLEFDTDFMLIENLPSEKDRVTGHQGHTFHYYGTSILDKNIFHSFWWLIFYESICYFMSIRTPKENNKINYETFNRQRSFD